MSLARLAATSEKYTVADITRMAEAGVFSPEDNFELIEGEIVPMSPKYHAHESIKSVIGMAMSKACPENLRVGFETSIFLSKTTIIEPDLCLYPANIHTDELTGPDLLIAIEVAATTLAYDRGRKAQIYARYGVRELWVIDAIKRHTFVYSAPSATGWGRTIENGPEYELSIYALPSFKHRLGNI